jgi:hypothetical protein
MGDLLLFTHRSKSYDLGSKMNRLGRIPDLGLFFDVLGYKMAQDPQYGAKELFQDLAHSGANRASQYLLMVGFGSAAFFEDENPRLSAHRWAMRIQASIDDELIDQEIVSSL